MAAAFLPALTVVWMCGTGCAGPSSPIGAPWVFSASEVKRHRLGELRERLARFVGANPEIRFFPPRQVLHERTAATVRVYDPGGIRENYVLIIRHNGLDVTKSFLRQATIRNESEGRELVLHIPSLKLSPVKEHVIEVAYGLSEKEILAYAWYEPPHCDAFDQRSLATTGSFHPSFRVVHAIENLSAESGFSAVFTAALIAQESGFNPRTVSWARALGLTQITPAADEELVERFPAWPRHPSIDQVSVPHLKFMVLSGSVNPKNDWRLDSERSIMGGLAYLDLLSKWWSTKENIRKVERAAVGQIQLPRNADFSEERTKLLLASYNSGFARVMNAVNRMGPGWLRVRELRGARRYVSRIFSFCDSFSEEAIVASPEVEQEGDLDENAT